MCKHSRTSQYFMEIESLLLCSQELSAGSRSIQFITRHPISLPSILILFTHLRLGLSNGLFLSGCPTNILYAFVFSPIRATCNAHLILRVNFIWRKVEIMISVHYVVFSNLLSFNLSSVQMFSSSLYSSLIIRDHVSHPYRTTAKWQFSVLYFLSF
jgi:hypothetical protein